MKAKSFVQILGALLLGIVVGAPLAVAQTGPDTPQHHTPAAKTDSGAQPQQGDMMAKCKAMMQQRQQMMQKCKRMDTQLDELAATMNAATGQKKIEAMADLLNELVTQRRSMHKMMMSMHGGMMSKMMGDMSQGSRPKCKMMQKLMQKMQKPSEAMPGTGSGTPEK